MNTTTKVLVIAAALVVNALASAAAICLASQMTNPLLGGLALAELLIAAVALYCGRELLDGGAHVLRKRFSRSPPRPGRRALARILVDKLEFPPTGAAVYYRDIATVVVTLACHLGGTSPSSAEDLLSRLEFEALMEAHGPDRLVGISARQVDQVRMRYTALFARAGLLRDDHRGGEGSAWPDFIGC
jgi:hypothetical protein